MVKNDNLLRKPTIDKVEEQIRVHLRGERWLSGPPDDDNDEEIELNIISINDKQTVSQIKIYKLLQIKETIIN